MTYRKEVEEVIEEAERLASNMTSKEASPILFLIESSKFLLDRTEILEKEITVLEQKLNRLTNGPILSLIERVLSWILK